MGLFFAFLSSKVDLDLLYPTQSRKSEGVFEILLIFHGAKQNALGTNNILALTHGDELSVGDSANLSHQPDGSVAISV